MSSWTYVNGIIVADTFGRTTAESMFIAQTVVSHLPRITGSEGCANFYIQQPKGHNVSCSTDELWQYSNLGDRRYGFFEAQTEVIISIVGKLRDRWFDQTLMETTKMLRRLSSRIMVTGCLVGVYGFGKSFVFNDPKWVTKADISDWTDKFRPTYVEFEEE